jgi:hypothetical protein
MSELHKVWISYSGKHKCMPDVGGIKLCTIVAEI